MFDDHVAYMPTSNASVVYFCLFFACFGSGDSVLFQNMHSSSPYQITVKTWMAGKFHQWQGRVINDRKFSQWWGNG